MYALVCIKIKKKSDDFFFAAFVGLHGRAMHARIRWPWHTFNYDHYHESFELNRHCSWCSICSLDCIVNRIQKGFLNFCCCYCLFFVFIFVYKNNFDNATWHCLLFSIVLLFNTIIKIQCNAFIKNLFLI